MGGGDIEKSFQYEKLRLETEQKSFRQVFSSLRNELSLQKFLWCRQRDEYTVYEIVERAKRLFINNVTPAKAQMICGFISLTLT
jgi:hypothetical protein